MAHFLYDFPVELLLMVCTYLTGKDIEQLCKCHSKFQIIANDEWLWESLVRRRFPPATVADAAVNAPTKHTSWRQYYMIKDRLQLSAAEDLVIVDANMPFWGTVESRESEYGAIAKLYSVRALDVSGIVQGVPRGQYHVQWRFRFGPSARWNEPLHFRAVVGNRLVMSFTTPDDFYARSDVLTNTWVNVLLPGVITIDQAFADVCVFHEKKSMMWKAGMEIDWVRLVPVDQVTDARKADDNTTLILQHEYQRAFWKTQEQQMLRCQTSSFSIRNVIGVLTATLFG